MTTPAKAAETKCLNENEPLEESVLSCIESWRLSQIREGSPVAHIPNEFVIRLVASSRALARVTAERDEMRELLEHFRDGPEATRVNALLARLDKETP